MTEREIFKVAFLKKCASAGMTLEQTEGLVDAMLAHQKQAADSAIGAIIGGLQNVAGGLWNRGLDLAQDAVKRVGPWAIPIAAVAPLGAGVIGGALTGETMGRIQDVDPEDYRAVEKVETLQQVAEALRNRDKLRKKQQTSNTYRPGRRLL